MSRKEIADYKNGNVYVKRFSDGTVIRYTEDDKFDFAYPENLDVKISDYCDMGCVMCHEGSSTKGKHGDILNAKWVDSLHPHTEIALGGGNVFAHPDFLDFVDKLWYKHVYVNITVNQKHFMDNLNLIRYLYNHNRIRGIGVSLVDPNDKFFEAIKEFPNLVIHVIAGMLDDHDLNVLMDRGKDVKLLILGYKRLRRGEDYYQISEKASTNGFGMSVDWKIGMIERMLPMMFEKFKVVSFDCLAIEQLHVKKYLPSQIWDTFFQGEDGTMTFYIDMVENKFAKSSTTPLEKRIDIDNMDINDMFACVKFYDWDDINPE